MMVPVDTAVFVIVDGPPAAGKSTLAPVLAQRLRLPLLAKDTTKDALMEVMPPTDVEHSRQLGRAAVRVMLALAAAAPLGAVLESNFYRSRASSDLARLPGRVVEVFCRCDHEVATARYRHRAATRAAGHFDHLRTDEELWNPDVAEPVAGGWPVIELDTNTPVDLSAAIAAIAHAAPWALPA
jgi:predicted kinase